MRSLFSKLSIALLVIIALIGGGFVFIDQFSTRLYYQELTQRLNAPIAMYITEQESLIAGSAVNGPALQELARHAMVINPSIEIYLLAPDGTIIAHALPPDSVVMQRVDIEPIERLLGGTAEPPLKGDDPRSRVEDKIFSAAEVRSDGALQGYVYVVLGGAQFDAVADTIRGAYARRSTLAAIATLLVIGLASGLLIFSLMTKRLRRLTASVRKFASDFGPHSIEAESSGDDDELGQLEHSFRRMAAEIDDQFQRLKESDRLRRELVSNVSHDLRTPLASMQGYVETLLVKNGSLSHRQRREYLLIARKHTQRLNQLIGDLFDLSKLESGSENPDFETFSLAELLFDTAQEFELHAKEKNISIEIDAPTDNTDVHADIGLIQRVFENLIRNAVHFTPAGGCIRIDLAKHPDSIAVAVSDTGRGIPAEQLPQIFDRFYSLETGAETDYGASGLGLAIVKRILDLHGSRITVTSELERGTRFEFALPVVRQVA